MQPAGDPDDWATPPFQLCVDGEVMRGHGVSDDKGPVYVAIKTAQAFIEQEGRIPLNVRFLFEGEEEIGSPHLPDFVASRASQLVADLVVSAPSRTRCTCSARSLPACMITMGRSPSRASMTASPS